MECPNGHGIMHNFDDLNFQCQTCQTMIYRSDTKREDWLLNHGSKRCPVCGHVCLQPGMLPNNGAGHVCLKCRAEFDFENDAPCIEVFPLMANLHVYKRHDHFPKRTLRLSTAFLLVLMIYLGGCAVIVKADSTEAIEFAIESDPFLIDVNDPVNIANMTHNDTMLAEWEGAFGGEINGTYYGSILPSSQFQHNLAPLWKENSTGGWEGKYTFMMLASHFNLSSQKLMSGSSEWWVRVPVHPASIECTFGLTLSIFTELTNATEVQLDTNYTVTSPWSFPVSGKIYTFRPRVETTTGYAPDVIIPYDTLAYANASAGEPLTDYLPTDDMRAFGGHLYVRVAGVLLPDTDYVLALTFRLPRDGTLMTYWCTAEEADDGVSVVEFRDVRLNEFVGSSKYIQGLGGNVTEIGAISLDWSFVFQEGCGRGGLFGRRLSLETNDVLVLYPFFNTSRSGDQYMSFMWPFISEDVANVTPQIYAANGDWKFANGDIDFIPELPYITYLTSDADEGTYNLNVTSNAHLRVGQHLTVEDDTAGSDSTFISEINDTTITVTNAMNRSYEVAENARISYTDWTKWEYYDWVLFSSNSTVNFTAFDDDDRWDVEVWFQFHEPIDLTALCYHEQRETVKWDEMDYDNSSVNPYRRPMVVDMDTDLASPIMAHQVYCSARGTDGQWAHKTMTPSGKYAYTHYHPNIIALNPGEWEVVTENGTNTETNKNHFDLFVEYWNSGEYLKALYHGFLSIFERIWDGGGAIVGFITDGLHDIWEGMKKLGSWIVTHAVEAFGWIYDVLVEAWDTLAGFWETAQYIVAPLLAVALIAGTGRLSVKMLQGRGS